MHSSQGACQDLSFVALPRRVTSSTLVLGFEAARPSPAANTLAVVFPRQPGAAGSRFVMLNSHVRSLRPYTLLV